MNWEHDKSIDDLMSDLKENDYGIPDRKMARGDSEEWGVSFVIAVMPERPSVHPPVFKQKLAEALPTNVTIQNCEQEEVAFGLYELVFELTCDESEAPIQDVISNLERVEEAERVRVKKS